uniref:HD domain-containing protein n=1 Tax=Ananas comosus var. bracteatus TaxID=296719 RepID=A0A6V7NM99_ANACO|nr:unnamed protein product [Ananas comosus var. bracteatus]
MILSELGKERGYISESLFTFIFLSFVVGFTGLLEKLFNALEPTKVQSWILIIFDVQTVKLAGLMHDIGHGPFSHLFEHGFLSQVLPGSNWSHEQMTVQLVDYIVDEHHIDIDAKCLKIVKEMIIASSNIAKEKSAKEKLFLYDSVANGRTGIDVDKF